MFDEVDGLTTKHHLKDRTVSHIWVECDVNVPEAKESTIFPNLIAHEYLCGLRPQNTCSNGVDIFQ